MLSRHLLKEPRAPQQYQDSDTSAYGPPLLAAARVLRRQAPVPEVRTQDSRLEGSHGFRHKSLYDPPPNFKTTFLVGAVEALQKYMPNTAQLQAKLRES